MGNMNLDNIAQATGGRAFYSRNDLEQILIDATNLGANYYTLTYAPSNQNYDGKLRKIKVNFPRKGYQLDYRRAYYADGLGSPVSQASSKQASSRKSAATEPAVAEPDDSLYAYMRLVDDIADDDANERTLAQRKGDLDQWETFTHQTIAAAGGESGSPDSKHFNDEAERYAAGNLRDVYFYPEQLKGHTVRTYHPF